jgi:hypothetical protein
VNADKHWILGSVTGHDPLERDRGPLPQPCLGGTYANTWVVRKDRPSYNRYRQNW